MTKEFTFSDGFGDGAAVDTDEASLFIDGSNSIGDDIFSDSGLAGDEDSGLASALGLSCQRPLWRAWEQDPEGVRRRLAEEYPAIRAQARRAGAEIYWGDEAGARSDYHGGTTWGLQGQTPVVRRTGGRSAVNMLSAISTRGQLRLFSLPPYSPELNPSEQAWNYVKHHGAARAALRGARELRRFVLARLRKQQKLPWTVRMFFLAPDTQYAAS